VADTGLPYEAWIALLAIPVIMILLCVPSWMHDMLGWLPRTRRAPRRRHHPAAILMSAAVLHPSTSGVAAETEGKAVAGQYCAGDGLTSIVTLTIGASGYEYTRGNDVPGSTPARAKGAVRAVGRVVRLEPAPLDAPGVYDAITWGERTYLVPEGRLREFCDSGDEPRRGCNGSFLVRTLDGVTPAGAASGKEPAACARARRPVRPATPPA
jgi:hypothetical protein